MKTITTITLCIIILISCQQKQESSTLVLDAQKAEIEKVLYNSVGGWALTKDTALLYSIIAKDENFLEVHPNNRVVKGFNEFKKAEKFWLDPRFKAVKCEIWDLHINFSTDGSVAWFYCMLNDINEWDGKPASWENTRWTGVLEKRDGKWRTVQQHFSFANDK
jgi:ketosteroid isomerase-like protein